MWLLQVHEQVVVSWIFNISMMARPTFFVAFSLAEYSDKRARHMHVLPSYVATEIVGNFEL